MCVAPGLFGGLFSDLADLGQLDVEDEGAVGADGLVALLAIAERSREEEVDLAALAENPADDLMLKSWFERDDEGAIGLRFDLELLHVLVFAEVERDTGIAAQTDAADPGIHEETVFSGVFYELFVGNECVSCKSC